jgi:hypothetical protein
MIALSIEGPVSVSVSATFCGPDMVAEPAAVPSELNASIVAGRAKCTSVASTAEHGCGSLISVLKPTSSPVNAPCVSISVLGAGLPVWSLTWNETPCSTRGFGPVPMGSAASSMHVRGGRSGQSQTIAPSSVP